MFDILERQCRNMGRFLGQPSLGGALYEQARAERSDRFSRLQFLAVLGDRRYVRHSRQQG